MTHTEWCFLIPPDTPDLEFHMCEVTGKARALPFPVRTEHTLAYSTHAHTHMLTNPHSQESKQDVEERAIALSNCCF